MAADPNSTVQTIANNIGYNLNAVTANLEAAKALILADLELPENERQITADTMMSMAFALNISGGCWNRIGVAINGLDDHMPPLPPPDEGDEELGG